MIFDDITGQFDCQLPIFYRRWIAIIISAQVVPTVVGSDAGVYLKCYTKYCTIVPLTVCDRNCSVTCSRGQDYGGNAKHIDSVVSTKTTFVNTNARSMNSKF